MSASPDCPAEAPPRYERGEPVTIVVTATADAPTRGDIAARLFVRKPRIFVRSFDRPNLFLAMRPKSDATRQLWDAVQRHPGESGIVYCGSRRRTEELAQEFSERGRRALPYHAGLAPDEPATLHGRSGSTRRSTGR